MKKIIQKSRPLRFAAMMSATALAVPFTVTPAVAQSTADATVDSNTIIVTAQRRAEALEDVPMSVAVVTPDTLNALGVNTLRDLQNVTSGFSLNNSGTYPQPAIRGITTTNSGSYENNVALWVDGLYQITPQILNMDLPNVQSIQVLKGAQGALYGRNATGGAILIDTIDPGRDFTGNVEATYGRFDDRRARGYVSGPLGDNIGFSLAGTYRKTDGYYNKVSPTDTTKTEGRTLGLEQQSIRAKITGELAEGFRATIGYNFTRANDPRGTFFTPTENLTAASQGNWGRGDVIGQAFELDFKQHEGLLKLEFDTGIGTLRSVTGYQHSTLVTTYDSGGITYTPSSVSDSKLVDNTWQENLDFTIDAIENLDLVVGATYFHNSEGYADGRANAALVAPAGSPIGTPISSYILSNERDSDRTKEAWAAFIDATFHVSDRLSVNLGARYSKEKQKIHAIFNNYCTVAAGCAGGVPLGGVTSTIYDARNGSTYSKFTPRASIRYEISPRVNVYASYSQGFKAGEWNGVIPANDPTVWKELGQIGQETVDAFEVGIKGADSNLRFDLAGFYYKYKDLQVSSVQFVGGVASVLLQNLPKARVYGIEGNVEYDVTPDFKVRAGGTWLNARYGSKAYYEGVGVNPAGAVAVPNASDPLKAFPNLFIPPLWQDLSGLQMTRAPDFSGYIGFEYNIPQGDGGLRFAANLKYTTSYVVTDPSIWGGETNASYQARLAVDPNAAPNNEQVFTAAGAAGAPYLDRASEQRARQGAYALINASVTWTDPTNHYYVRIWGNNLTNEKYAVHYRPSSRTYIPIGEPLTFGGTIGYKF
ncbi:MAG: TonB-dependent receptor [Novosphingobium sp.]